MTQAIDITNTLSLKDYSIGLQNITSRRFLGNQTKSSAFKKHE